MNKLNIPKTIHVGYQARQDTYTGKLAYVIYSDEKGKMRKETSWNSWRNKDFGQSDFSNEPTSGFVLNKGVGGARRSYGWNARNEYIRIYDPRDFEFEISVANLLFILQECNSIKGKGLEGEFVYAWQGTELVLLPVGCEEYKSSTEFTDAKSMKVTKTDMVEGCIYQNKQMEDLMYLGRELCRPEGVCSARASNYERRLFPTIEDPTEKRHVFYHLENKKYVFEKGFTKLAKRLSLTPDPDFAQLHADYINSEYHSKLKSIEFVPVAVQDLLPKDAYSYSKLFFVDNEDGSVTIKQIAKEDWYNRHYPYKYGNRPEYILQKSKILDAASIGEYVRPYELNRVFNTIVETANATQILANKNLYTVRYTLESGITKGVDYFV